MWVVKCQRFDGYLAASRALLSFQGRRVWQSILFTLLFSGSNSILIFSWSIENIGNDELRSFPNVCSEFTGQHIFNYQRVNPNYKAFNSTLMSSRVPINYTLIPTKKIRIHTTNHRIISWIRLILLNNVLISHHFYIIFGLSVFNSKTFFEFANQIAIGKRCVLRENVARYRLKFFQFAAIWTSFLLITYINMIFQIIIPTYDNLWNIQWTSITYFKGFYNGVLLVVIFFNGNNPSCFASQSIATKSLTLL